MRHTRYQGLVLEDGHVLLIQVRDHGEGETFWLIPGGGRDGDESPEACVVREIREETNLDVAVEGLLLEESELPGGLYHRRETYLCRVLGGEPSPGVEPEMEGAQGFEIAQVRWFDLRDVSGWGGELLGDLITYPQLVKLRRKLGYLP